jgi:CDGSH-type Zn-finger protein
MSDSQRPRPDGPVIEECEAGRYAWCACGKSSKGVHCDGSHRGSEARPVIVDLDEKKRVAWCACGKSAAGAFCDGSHAR